MRQPKSTFAVGERFRTIGCVREYIVVSVYLAADFIPSVVGHSGDGKQTCAREADIVRLEP